MSQIMKHTLNAKVGETIKLPCTTTLDAAVDWTFQSVVSDKIFYVYSDGELVRGYEERFYIETPSKGHYDLVIRQTQLSDNGMFTCTEDGGFGHRHQMGVNVSAIVAESGTCTHAALPAVITGVIEFIAFGVLLATLVLCRNGTKRNHLEQQPLLSVSAVNVDINCNHKPLLTLDTDLEMCGLTVVTTKVYAVFRRSETIAVYDAADDYKNKENITIKGLSLPAGFVSFQVDGKLCLLLGDMASSCVWQVDLSTPIENSVVFLKLEEAGQRVQTLHAMRNGQLAVLVASESWHGLRWTGRVDVYGSDKKLLRTVDMTMTGVILNPLGLFETKDGFIVSYGSVVDNVHGVVEMNARGSCVARATGSFNMPLACAFDDEEQCVIVADTNNDRIVALNRKLMTERVLMRWSCYTENRGCPTCIFYDRISRQLIVGLRSGHILICSV